MPNPIIRIHNTETNEVIDREMTDQEFTQYEAEQAIVAARIAEAETKATVRQAVLNRLGLTPEELATLLS